MLQHARAKRTGDRLHTWHGLTGAFGAGLLLIAAGCTPASPGPADPTDAVSAAPAAPARSPGDRARPASPPLERHPHASIEIVSHRGANKVAPENTFAAAQVCVDWGVDYVEVDVRESADGVLYIMHDFTVDRTTDGTGPISRMTSDQIDRLDAGSWFGPEYAGEPVPRLADYLAWIRGRAKVYVDFKDGSIPALVELIRESGMSDQMFFWSGSRQHTRAFRDAAPDIPIKINASTAEQLESANHIWAMEIVECGPGDLNATFLQAARDLGVRVMLYTNDNNPEVFLDALRHAELINLDHPGAFIRAERGFLADR